MEIKTEAGKIYQGKQCFVVKKIMNAGEKIPRHNHAGQDILFTVLKGKVAVQFNDQPFHTATPGDIIHFDGKNFISADIIEDAEIQVTLINQ